MQYLDELINTQRGIIPATNQVVGSTDQTQAPRQFQTDNVGSGLSPNIIQGMMQQAPTLPGMQQAGGQQVGGQLPIMSQNQSLIQQLMQRR